VRYVPVGETIEAHPMALPSDRLEEVLDRYKVFAVGLCQCRMTEEIVGRGCGRPMKNCVAFGDVAEFLIRNGKMRRVEEQDVLEIKAEAASAGLASFKQHAIQMEPTLKYRQPPKRLLSTVLQMAPNYLRNAWSVWRKYR